MYICQFYWYIVKQFCMQCLFYWVYFPLHVCMVVYGNDQPSEFEGFPKIYKLPMNDVAIDNQNYIVNFFYIAA